MRYGRFAGLAAIVTACVMAASGCTDSGPEGTTVIGEGETTTAAPSPSPTATATASANPNKAEAEALVKRFVAALGTMTKTGDPAQMLSLCTKDSETCQISAKFAQDLKRDGGSYIGDAAPRFAQFASRPEGTDPIQLQAYVTYSTYKWTRKRGEQPKTVKGGQVLFTFVLTREGNEWKVESYQSG